MRAEGPRPDPLAPLIEALHADGRLRVWSLVVTVFGDAVAPRGGRIAAARLGELAGRVGVGEGALRTALSRLVAEGMLEREREGRASFHRLAAGAAREAEAASAVIYAPPAGSAGWTMGTGPAPGRALELPGGAWLSREAPPRGAVAVTGALSGAGLIAPGAAHRRALDRLTRDLDALGDALGRTDVDPAAARDTGPRGRRDGAPGLAPLDAMAARTLLIHRWRRIALRWPDLPEPTRRGVMGRPAASRSDVAAAYGALLPASEAWLDAALGDPDGLSAASGRPVERRFG